MYFLKVYFLKGFFSSKFYFLRVYFPKMCCFFPKRNILSSDKKRKTSFQTFFKPESELKLSLFWWKNFSSLFGVQFKKIGGNVKRPKKTYIKLVWSGHRYTTLHIEFIIMLWYSVVKRSNIKGDTCKNPR